jgi:antitoxin (DNA-binding transcriptional repressor) of toxin-antitoxin stability system
MFKGMEVTITQFRRELFDLVNQAMNGAEVWVTHKGRRFRIEPEKPKGSKLARLTKCDYLVNVDVPDDGLLLKEMTKAWEKDWDEM